jgi:hypothetical protein
MNAQKHFETFISKQIQIENSLIYKNNLELLRQFYNFILKRFKDVDIATLYLSSFNKLNDITSSKIEENFSKIVLELIDNDFDHFNLDELNQYIDKSGIYFIFNNINNLIYIGKSKHLATRALQSFINKMPYGSTYIKIIELDDVQHLSIFESVSIDFFMPLYNNKLEEFNLSHKSYSKLLRYIETKLNENKPIYPTSKKLDYED